MDNTEKQKEYAIELITDVSLLKMIELEMDLHEEEVADPIKLGVAKSALSHLYERVMSDEVSKSNRTYSEGDLDDILTTAFYGSEFLYNYQIDAGEVAIRYDHDGTTKVAKRKLEDVIAAIVQWEAEFHETFELGQADQGDCEDVLQYLLFGEIVYG